MWVMMTNALASDLRQRLEALARSQPDTRLQFIVTLRRDGNAAHVAAQGMTIDHRIPAPPLLLGTMTPGQALVVAGLDDVERVEHDAGSVYALPDTS